jgi:hypothetical protein
VLLINQSNPLVVIAEGLIVVGIAWTAKKYRRVPGRAWLRLTRFRHFWEHVETHIVGFEISPKTKVSSDARLEVLICNFTRREIAVSLLIENWSVAGCVMPRAEVSSSLIKAQPGRCQMLVVYGTPTSDDLTRLEGPVPPMARIREGYPVTLAVRFEGWLTLTKKKRSVRRQFNATFDYGKVRLLPPPEKLPRTRQVSPDDFGL